MIIASTSQLELFCSPFCAEAGPGVIIALQRAMSAKNCGTAQLNSKQLFHPP